MIGQEELFLEKDWDIAIFLDACRYDYFKEMYSNYLDGELKKTWSPGSSTFEYCYNVFGKNPDRFKDTMMITANPHLNSHVPLKRMGLTFDPSDKFKEYEDVWTEEYLNEINTTPPEIVAKHLAKAIKNKDRIIAWYLQPHPPYLSLDMGRRHPLQPGRPGKKIPIPIKEWVEKIEPYLGYWLSRQMWKVYDKFFDFSGIRKITIDHGEEKVIESYKYNLHRALKSIKETVLPVLDDQKVIITADHGEVLLWEETGGKVFGHPYGRNFKELKEVPYFVLE